MSVMGVGLQYVGPCVYTPTSSKNLMTNPRAGLC